MKSVDTLKMRRKQMPNLSDDDSKHDHNCECDKCIEEYFDKEFDSLDCGGCGWCTECFELAHQYWNS